MHGGPHRTGITAWETGDPVADTIRTLRVVSLHEVLLRHVQFVLLLCAAGCSPPKSTPVPSDPTTVPVTTDEPGTSTDSVFTLDPFDVHFVVLTAHPDAPAAGVALVDPSTNVAYEGQDFFEREIEILNTYFVQEDRTPVSGPSGEVRFQYRSHSYLADLAGTPCDLLQFGDMTDPALLPVAPAGQVDVFFETFKRAVLACTDPLLVPPRSVLFFVYDAHWVVGGKVSNANRTSLGGYVVRDDTAEHIPMVILDHSRLLHAYQAAEEHEMGHAFGLAHNHDPDVRDEPEPGTTLSPASNIMQRGGTNCEGEPDAAIEQGDRSVGFQTVDHVRLDGTCTTVDQVAVISTFAAIYQSSW